MYQESTTKMVPVTNENISYTGATNIPNLETPSATCIVRVDCKYGGYDDENCEDPTWESMAKEPSCGLRAVQTPQKYCYNQYRNANCPGGANNPLAPGLVLYARKYIQPHAFRNKRKIIK